MADLTQRVENLEKEVAELERLTCPKQLKELYFSIEKNIRANDAISAMKNLDEVLKFREMDEEWHKSKDESSEWYKRCARKIHSMSRFKWIDIMHTWHLLDTKSINELVSTINEWKNTSKDLKILEIGAGMGFLAYFLKHFDIEMTATDSYSELQNLTPFTEVLKMDYETALNTYNPDVLIVSWGRSRIPFELFKGKYYIYIGEEPGGCTSGYPNDGYDSDSEIEVVDSWKLIKKIEMPCFYGLNDENILIFERK